MESEAENPVNSSGSEEKLVSVEVHGLFGELDHKIDLSVDAPVTIVQGENGVGKTTVLRILNALFNRKLLELSRLPFRRVTVTFDSGRSLQVTRVAQRPREGQGLEFILNDPQVAMRSTVLDPKGRLPDIPMSMVDDFIPQLDRFGPRQWLDRSVGEVLELDEVFDKYGDQFPERLFRDGFQISDAPWLMDILRSCTVSYIRAQRLSVPEVGRGRVPHRLNERREVSAIAVFAEQLEQQIAENLARYAERSQSLDSTFPSRVMRSKISETAEGISGRYQLQAETRAKYVQAGLLDEGEVLALPHQQIDDAEIRLLQVYLEDTDKKLGELEALAAKISLFKRIVNSKLRRKALTVSRNKGFEVQTPSGDKIALTDLSSGEQQQIVLMYQLLFQYDTGTLVLIDEPELSLHVSWQMRFLDDILEVANLSRLSFMLATHSPQIINDRWDLTREMSE